VAEFNALTVIPEHIYICSLGTVYSNNKMRKIEF